MTRQQNSLSFFGTTKTVKVFDNVVILCSLCKLATVGTMVAFEINHNHAQPPQSFEYSPLIVTEALMPQKWYLGQIYMQNLILTLLFSLRLFAVTVT